MLDIKDIELINEIIKKYKTEETLDRIIIKRTIIFFFIVIFYIFVSFITTFYYKITDILIKYKYNDIPYSEVYFRKISKNSAIFNFNDKDKIINFEYKIVFPEEHKEEYQILKNYTKEYLSQKHN